ncbi:MAG: magnesium transporter CorA family protein [Candidatus Doudnabacteria bacterium]|nr:magnesium transporter CorA family protein [Candidatus Doudnabacteria bacterium]
MATKIIHTKNLRWVDIVNPDNEDLLYLKNNFKFHPLDFEDIVATSTRTKIDEYDAYHFIILLFPYFNTELQEIRPAEVDFFVGKDYLITIHDGSMKTLSNLIKNVAAYDNVRTEYMGLNAGFLLFSILELLFKRSFPILDKINKEIAQAGKEAFELDLITLHKLAKLKRNIIMYRRIMKMHKFILTKLAYNKREYMMFRDSKVYFQNLIETAENIWDVLASDKESVESFEDTNQSLASHNINRVLQILTILSVVIATVTMITDIMIFFERVNIEKYLGLTSDLQLVILVTAVQFLIVGGMLLLFRRKRWL